MSFAGVVRVQDNGRTVQRLQYTAHPDAQQVLEEVAATLSHRFPECRIALSHRVGNLSIGDAALVVSVASPHRTAAFFACASVVDAVKAELPVWKRQVFANGTDEWVNSA